MILIEYFDKSPLANISSCLNLQPDKMIFIGSVSEMEGSFERYCQFIKKRDIETVIDFRDTTNKELNEIIDILEEIIKTGEECVLDLNGGEPIILTAGAMVYERLKDDYPVTMQRVDISDGNPEDCDNDGYVKDYFEPVLSAKEIVFLHGGVVAPDTPQPPHNFKAEDLAPFWDEVTKDPSAWNSRTAALLEIESRAGAKGEHLEVHINFQTLRHCIKDYTTKRRLVDKLIADLEKGGIISIESKNETYFCYRYKNQTFRRCIKKVGNVLEYKTFLEAKEFIENNEPFFNSCLMSVNIDWDGVLHNKATDKVIDTKNEIDVMLVHGLIPVFVSCKNGDVDEEELYKFNTVAERFGGKYVKKLLVATNFATNDNEAPNALLQRAQDMGIVFETDAAHLTRDGWQDLFRNVVKTKT